MTGFRDVAFNIHHKNWGMKCYGVDLDFPLCEYDISDNFIRVCAIIEYKKYNAPFFSVKCANAKALAWLANRAEIPSFLVIYNKDFTIYKIAPLNGFAESHIPKRGATLIEEDYVDLLYRLRGKEMPVETRKFIRGRMLKLNFEF